MAFVFFGEDDLVFGDHPVDFQIRIIPCDRSFRLRTIETVALVLEDHLVAQDAESVCEPFGNEKLPVVVFGKLDRHVFPESL